MNILLRFQPPRFRPQLENAQAGAVIDEDFRFGQLRGRGRQARKIALRQKAIAHFLQVHPCARAKQPLHKLLAAHFQTEDRYRQLAVDRDMLRDIHRQRRFSHARSRRDDDHLGFVQAVGHPIELGEASGNPGDSAATLVELLDRFDRAPSPDLSS